jgi:hypothetical protein
LFCRALHRREFTQEEIAMVSSLELGTAEEAKKLVPSLEVSKAKLLFFSGHQPSAA